VLAVQLYYLKGCKLAAAAHELVSDLKRLKWRAPGNPSDFIRTHVENFQNHGTVEDAPRPGRPPAVADDVAKQGADMFAEGYDVPVYDSNGEDTHVTVHFYYTSIEDAVARCEPLALLVQEVGVTPKTFFQHMMAINPHLKRVSADYRMLLSAAHKQMRQRMAAAGYNRWVQDPTVFERTVMIDCASITFKDAHTTSNHYYKDERDTRYHYIIKWNGFKEATNIKLKFIVAVNAKVGGVYFAFTSGTTDIIRDRLWHNSTHNRKSYKVSHVLL
jgi:hypothetical protein